MSKAQGPGAGPHWTRALAGAERWLSVVAGALLAAMAALISIDVVARYFLSRPLPGGFELVELTLAITVFSALPIVTLNHGHITIDLFDAILPPRLIKAQITVANYIIVIVFLMIGYAVWIQAGKARLAGLRTDVLELPLYVPIYYLALMAFVSALALILRLVFNPLPATADRGEHD